MSAAKTITFVRTFCSNLFDARRLETAWANISTVASDERLSIEAKREGQRTVLCLRGELDLENARLLQRALETADVKEASTVLVDLRGLQFMDSTGLRELLTAHQRLQERGAELVVTGASVQVERLFSVTQVSKHLKMVAPPDAPP